MAALGPVELLFVEFPGNQFTGEIIPELTKLIDEGTIAADRVFEAPGDRAGVPAAHGVADEPHDIGAVIGRKTHRRATGEAVDGEAQPRVLLQRLAELADRVPEFAAHCGTGIAGGAEQRGARTFPKAVEPAAHRVIIQ